MKHENIGAEGTAPVKKKRWKKILLIILCVILAAIVAVGIWQRNNIKALYYFLSIRSTEDISRRIEENKKEHQEVVSKYISSGEIRDFTEAEEQRIISGEISVEAATEIIRQEFKNSGKSSEGSVESTGAATDLDDFIAENIIQLYSYKAYYLGQLGQIEKAAVADYKALAPKERTLVNKQSIVDKYMNTANGLLGECDSRVAEITAKLKARLTAENMDLELIDKIKSSYEEEKALKKAYYMSLLNS